MIAARVIDSVDFRDHAAVQQACAQNEDGDVSERSDDRGIGHEFGRRTVKEYIVILLTVFFDQLFQPVGVEQFRGVGGNGAYGEQVETRTFGLLDVFVAVVSRS